MSYQEYHPSLAEEILHRMAGHLSGYECICPIPADGTTPRSCYRPCWYQKITGKKCPLGKDETLDIFPVG